MFEGSQLANTKFVYLAEGAYGAVFVDRERNRVRKIAYRKQNFDEVHCREIFKAELDALRIAESREELVSLIAAPVDQLEGVVILGSDARDISMKFYTDLVFEAEFIEGIFVKIGATFASNRELIKRKFRAAGIKHLADASVVVDQGKIQKVIDIATHEIEAFWDIYRLQL